MSRRLAVLLIAALAAACVAACAGPLPAETADAPVDGAGDGTRATDPPERRITLWDTILSGGPIGYVIMGISVVAVALVVEHFITIRRDRLVPGPLAQRVEQHLAAGNEDAARQACIESDSFLGRVLGAGLEQVGSMFGFFDMQNAMQEVSEREISRLYRKLEYLSFIAATAPMLGLLGTVTGMIASFNEIAVSEGTAAPSQLAGGISEALITTCMGLIVAIPTMFFVSLFRNRIDSAVAEAETIAEKVMGRFRQKES